MSVLQRKLKSKNEKAKAWISEGFSGDGGIVRPTPQEIRVKKKVQQLPCRSTALPTAMLIASLTPVTFFIRYVRSMFNGK